MYQTRLNRFGNEPHISDDIRFTFWIDLLPHRERDDVTRHRHFWKDADALDRHLLQLISDRAREAPTSIAQVSVEEDEEYLEAHYCSETGDTHLFRVEATTGRRKFVTIRRARQSSQERKFYRCGRHGHIGIECHAQKYIDGGPVRLPTKPPREL